MTILFTYTYIIMIIKYDNIPLNLNQTVKDVNNVIIPKIMYV